VSSRTGEDADPARTPEAADRASSGVDSEAVLRTGDGPGAARTGESAGAARSGLDSGAAVTRTSGNTGAARGRRELALVVAACVLAAALALLAASRPWLESVSARPAPLPPLRLTRSGAAIVPALPALALVALASAGGVLATRGLARRLVGVLMAGAGLGVAAVALGAAGGGVWRAGCVVAGAVVAAAGVVTALRAGRWPAMGARFEAVRRPVTTAPDAPPGELWDALDRGTDPTKA
jgi:hypothetical protein